MIRVYMVYMVYMVYSDTWEEAGRQLAFNMFNSPTPARISPVPLRLPGFCSAVSMVRLEWMQYIYWHSKGLQLGQRGQVRCSARITYMKYTKKLRIYNILIQGRIQTSATDANASVRF